MKVIYISPGAAREMRKRGVEITVDRDTCAPPRLRSKGLTLEDLEALEQSAQDSPAAANEREHSALRRMNQKLRDFWNGGPKDAA